MYSKKNYIQFPKSWFGFVGSFRSHRRNKQVDHRKSRITLREESRKARVSESSKWSPLKFESCQVVRNSYFLGSRLEKYASCTAAKCRAQTSRRCNSTFRETCYREQALIPSMIRERSCNFLAIIASKIAIYKYAKLSVALVYIVSLLNIDCYNWLINYKCNIDLRQRLV